MCHVAGLALHRMVLYMEPDGPWEARMGLDYTRTIRSYSVLAHRTLQVVAVIVSDMNSSAYHNMAVTEKAHLLSMYLAQLFKCPIYATEK
jgi:hypothetical protein